MTKPQRNTRVVSGLGPAVEAHGQGAAMVPHPPLGLDPRTYARTQDCVQCGLCLPACPTYVTTGQEADSPRGRIRLIKALADGRIEPSPPVVNHLDLCLDCRACETACPSGVGYHELIEKMRARLTERPTGTVPTPPWIDRLIRAFVSGVLTHPNRLKASLLPVRALQRLGLWGLLTGPRLGRMIPPRLLKLMRILPSPGPMWPRRLDGRYASLATGGVSKAVVGMFEGCVGGVLEPDINRQAVELLRLAGCDVLVAQQQVCCGAIHHHGGEVKQARALARANIDAFMGAGNAGSGAGKTVPNVDYIVNTVAGCGAMLKEYPHLLRDDPVYAKRAAAFASRVRDICELLVELELPRPTHPLPPELRVATYHDACHLAHAQQITAAPRQLLGSIDGLELVPLAESDMCCGAAGTYSLTQPAMAAELGERKVRCIAATGAGVCVTGNIGCAMQIQAEARRLGVEVRVVHPVTLLYRAYTGDERRA